MRAGFIALIRSALVLVLLSLPLAAYANAPDPELLGKRVALVIGNGAYGELGELPNPPNDASDIAAKLEALHFKVVRVIDGDRATMVDALRDFGQSAAGADVALFFYAGHGMAMDGENYLVPVHAPIKDKLSLRFEALSLSDVRDTLESSGAPLKMVILDACRDNPLAKRVQQNSGPLGRSVNASSGLAETDTMNGSGWSITYATQPGNVALDGEGNQRNSPFTQALLAHIGDENVDARVMFGYVREAVLRETNERQIPWNSDSMRGTFQFNPVAVKPAEPPVDPALAAWRAIRDSDAPSDFEDFLANFPDSDFAAAARYQLSELRDPARERAAWDTAQASDTPAAYEKFLHNYPSSPYASAARTLLGAALISSSDRAAMEAYLARFPNGPFAAQINQRLSALDEVAMAEPEAPAPRAAAPETAAAAPAAGPAPGERALELAPPAFAPEADLSPESVARLSRQVDGTQIQYALKALGLYTGRVDGKLGPASRRAIASFQSGLGTEATGEPAPREVVALIGQAASGGDAYSQTIYGGMFATGAGVAKDMPKSVDWYRRAAEAGNGYGQLNLGYAYANGWGVAKDVASARRWLMAARDQDIPEADHALRTLGD